MVTTSIYTGLNTEQAAAVQLCDRPTLVLAGAGSGKTRVITHKIAYLINQKSIPAEQVVAVTFTNKAAREMQGRVNKMLKGNNTKGLTVSTFHSLGLKILRRQLSAAGLKSGFTIFDSDDSLKVIKELIKSGSKDEDIQYHRRRISAWKNDNVSPEQAAQTAETGADTSSAELFLAYQRQLKAYNAVDFDDLIGIPLRLLREHADICRHWRSRIAYLLVDEYQDTNTAQYELLKLIMHRRHGFTAVGDDDQSIYAWRGARPENLEKLRQDFPELEVIKLEQNYRSTSRILSCANRLIANNPRTFEKNLWGALGMGDPIRILPCRDHEHEAETIVSNIITQRFRHKTKPGDIAILYRGNHQSRPVEKMLRLNRLAYKISGGQSFFDRAEVKDILAYLRLVTNADDDTAFLRIINTPRRQIGAATLEKLGLYANQRGVSLLVASQEMNLRSVLNKQAVERLAYFTDLILEAKARAQNETPDATTGFLVREIHYADWLRELSRDQATADRRYENVEELIAWIRHMYASDNLDLNDVITRITLLDMLDKNDSKDADNMISLMTLHAAKGLEFPHVYLIGFEEGLLPHQNSIDEDRIEEERRLAYVGVTRAQTHLTLSYTGKRRRYGEDLICEPSRFLQELPGEHLQFADEESPEVKKETGRASIANLKAILNQGL